MNTGDEQEVIITMNSTILFTRFFFTVSNPPSDISKVDTVHIPSSDVAAEACDVFFFAATCFSSTIVAIVASNIFQNSTLESILVHCVSPPALRPHNLSFESFFSFRLIASPRSPIPKTTKRTTTISAAHLLLLHPPPRPRPPLATPSPVSFHYTASISPSRPVALVP